MSAYDTIIDKLVTLGIQVKGSAARSRAQCPVHQSNSLTLSIRQGENKVQLRCFAGCETIDVLETLGLGYRDLYDDDLPADYTPPPKRVLTPWEAALASIGIHDGPPIEHLLHRIMVEQEKERRAEAGESR